MLRMLLLAGVALSAPVFADAPVEIEGATTIDLVQAAHLHYRGAVFVDVRADDKWQWGHVAGAVHLNYLTDFPELARRDVPRDLPLVIYCDSDLCSHGPRAVAQAVAWGYRQVFYFRNGFFAWQLADLPQGQGLGSRAPALNAQAR